MKKATFTEIMQQNGFQYTGKNSYDGNFIFGREWRKTENVLWHGEMESSFRIEAYESYGYPMVTLYENGRQIDRRGVSRHGGVHDAEGHAGPLRDKDRPGLLHQQAHGGCERHHARCGAHGEDSRQGPGREWRAGPASINRFGG